MSKYMVIFTLIVIVSYFTALYSKMHPLKRVGVLGQRVPNPIGFIVPAVLFTVFSGLRRNLGDTESYIHSFNLIDPEEIGANRFTIESEIFFSWLQNECRLKSDDPQTLLMITAIFSCVPIIWFLYKYACPYELSLYLYVTTAYFSFSMNGIRQYMAAGVLILGSKYLFSPKKLDFLKYAIFVLLAWLCHSSALIMLLFYWIVRRRAWSPLTVVMLVGTVIATLAFDSFLPSFLGAIEDTSYAEYSANGWFTSGVETGSSVMRVIVLAVPVVIAAINRRRLERFGLHGDILTNMALLNLMIYTLSLYNWIFARIAIYTSVYTIVFTCWVIVEGFNKKDGKFVYWLSVALYAFYFYNASYSIVAYVSNKY